MGVKKKYRTSPWKRSAQRQAVRAAFSELEKRGIHARMRWGHCRVCAASAISRMIALRPSQAQVELQWAFYTRTDFYRAMETGVLRITYGNIRPQNAARTLDIAVGDKVVEVLKRHGLNVEWDRDPERRIAVEVGFFK